MISQDQIERLAPRSIADILKLVPGVYVETSGTAGVHIGGRSFPQNSDGAFATVQLDGPPIFAPNTLSFLKTFSLLVTRSSEDGYHRAYTGPITAVQIVLSSS